MNRLGKRGRAWENARRKLKRIFESKGILTCELRYPGCWHDNGLGFMHRVKRRKITSDEELLTVALACNFCHAQAEFLSPDEMFRIVTETIEQRLS
jgi:hypothetical protein